MATAWLLIVWGLASAPLGFVSKKMSSISPCPRFEREVRLVDQWIRQRGPGNQLLIGPLGRQYEPWMSSFDEWYPVKQIRVVQSLAELRESLASQAGPGVWVADGVWLREHGWDLEPLIHGGLLRMEFQAGDYAVYAWGTPGSQETRRIRGPSPRVAQERPTEYPSRGARG